MEVFILFILMAKEWDQEKWEKKWDNMDPWERDMAVRNTAEFYGIEGTRPGGRPGEFWDEDERRTDEVLRDLNDHWSNGAVGTYLMASGQDLPLASDAAGMVGVHRALEANHPNLSGGNFNEQSDVWLAGRAAWEDAFEDLEDDDDDEPVVTPEPEPEEEDEPYIASKIIADANEHTDDYHDRILSGERSEAVFGKGAAAASPYVINLKSNLQPSIQTNTRNAIDLVLGRPNPHLDQVYRNHNPNIYRV